MLLLFNFRGTDFLYAQLRGRMLLAPRREEVRVGEIHPTRQIYAQQHLRSDNGAVQHINSEIVGHVARDQPRILILMDPLAKILAHTIHPPPLIIQHAHRSQQRNQHPPQHNPHALPPQTHMRGRELQNQRREDHHERSGDGVEEGVEEGVIFVGGILPSGRAAVDGCYEEGDGKEERGVEEEVQGFAEPGVDGAPVGVVTEGFEGGKADRYGIDGG